jgi:hypothetical protein
VHSCSGFFCIPGAVIILYHRLDEGFWASDVQSFVAD